MHPWCHYIALGDSFTEGVGDPVEGFAMLGVADRLAAALRQANPDLRFTNLAQRGLGTNEIFEQQLEPALRLQPDLVSVVAGANDVLTGRFSAARWGESFGRMFEAFAQANALVIVATLPDFPVLRTLPAALQARVRGNLGRGNDVIQRLAAQHRCVLIDAWAISARSEPADWSEDGVHLNARGYFKFAQEVFKTLEQRTGMAIGEIEAP
jgi:lysophospholipase L1-like esterase